MTIDVISAALPPQLDGIGDYTARLARQLASTGGGGARIGVLTTCEHAVADVEGVEVVPSFAASCRRSVFRLVDVVSQRQPDWLVLQFNQFSFGRWGLNPMLPLAMARTKRRSPRTRVAVMFHEDFVPAISWKFAVMRLWQKWQFKQLGRLADVVLFSIDPWVRKYQSWFPGKPVLHLPAASNIPRVPIDRSDAKRRLGIVEDQVVVGLFGSVHAGRNLPWFHAAVRAVRAVRAAGIDAVVLYIGADGRTVREAVGGLPVIAEGPLPADEVSRRLAAIDVYLAPLSDGVSTRRGSMMAGLEHGLAIVGTRGEATDEVLAREHGRAMLLADVNAMPAFEAHVRTLLVDAERRRELGSAAEALYEREFAWPRIAEKLMAILSGCESHSSQSRDAGARPARIHELPGARHAVATLAAAEGTAGR